MKKILIADDDRVWVELLGTILRAKGFEVLTAFDGMQATMAAINSVPDAIVLDVQMPGGTGLEALKRIKMSTKTRTLPVLVVTGTQDPTLSQKTTEMGADAFVRKPVTPEAIRDAVCALLGVG